MKFALVESMPKTDLLIILMKKDQKLSPASKKAMGTAATKEAELRMKNKDFETSEGATLVLYTGEKDSAKKVVLMGQGDSEKWMPGAVLQHGGKCAALAATHKAKTVVIITQENKEIQDLSYGMVYGNYEFTKYKKKDPKEEKKKVKLTKVTFLGKKNKEISSTLKKAENLVNPSALIRDMVNAPTSDMDTNDFVRIARQVGKKYGIKVTVYDDKKLQKMGAGLLYGVGKGAEVGARMIFLEYKHKTKSKTPNIAFVGKGIVFDTGGLNVKPTNYIELMKQDMAGAATVLGTMQALAQEKVPGYWLGVLCCAENAVSEKAQRPGDVAMAYNGMSVEITNTDAEGRLAMADGLAYTEKKYKPQRMVNIATLTGAVSVALGYHITGVMGSDKNLVADILKASEKESESMWELPLTPDMIKATKGSYTDLINSSRGVRAGSSMGGAFLKNFVEKTPWAHFDIGGTAWAEKPNSTTKYGSTAVALRTFMELARMHQG
jgi:leucyl aminopeptidase